MSTDYAIFDNALLSAIRAGAVHFYQLNTGVILQWANEVAARDRRGDLPGWRLIDRRLQALRKRGVLTFDRKAGWRVC